MRVTMFSASWCAPCKAIKPIFAALEKAYPETEFRILSIDDPDTSQQTVSQALYGLTLSSIPAFMIDIENEPIDFLVGNRAKPSEIEKWLK